MPSPAVVDVPSLLRWLKSLRWLRVCLCFGDDGTPFSHSGSLLQVRELRDLDVAEPEGIC